MGRGLPHTAAPCRAVPPNPPVPQVSMQKRQLYEDLLQRMHFLQGMDRYRPAAPREPAPRARPAR